MSNPKEIDFGNILELHRGYDLPTAKRIDGEIPVYGSSGVSGWHNDYKCDGETIITGRYGTIGKVFYHNGKCWPLNTSLFLSNAKGNNVQYLGYLLQYAFNELLHIKGQDKSAVPGIDRNVIHSLKTIFWDNKDYQKLIANFLGNIDCLIDNNQHIIGTLESIAKNLYDYWFVQFDFPDANGRPYKTSGGKMEWNEILSREIPAGWEVDNLFRIASYVNGLACQKFRPQDGEESLPVIKIREMHEGISSDTECVSAGIPSENVIEDGDILFSWSATLEIQYWTGGKGGLNQHIFKVIPSNCFPKEYVYHQLKDYIVNFVKIAEARKTTMGHITQDHLNFSRIAIPPADVLKRFEERMKPIHKQMIKLNQENRQLSSLRDYLLPLLMNGQVTFRQ